MTATADTFWNILPNVRKKDGMIFHENCQRAVDSHKITWLCCYLRNSSKIWNCCLLQIIGGALWVNHANTIILLEETIPWFHKFFVEQNSKWVTHITVSWLSLCLLGNFSCFFVVQWFFQSYFFLKKNLSAYFHQSVNQFVFRFVGPDFGSNFLQKLSADDTR